MSKLYKPTNYPLQKLISDIDIGDLGLPDLQRPFVWDSSKVRDLIDSIYKGYPVGFFLFWENDGSSDKSNHIGLNEKGHRIPKLTIIDGQQRLTSLYAVIKGCEVKDENFQTKKIKIAFNPIEEKFEVSTPALEKSPERIGNISNLWNGASIVKIIGSYITTLSEKQPISNELENLIQDRIINLYNITNINFGAFDINSDVDIEIVSDIFVRINSKGKQLNQADFILTLLSVYWDEGRKQIEDFCNNKDKVHNGFEYLTKPLPADIIRILVGYTFYRGRLSDVYTILRGRDLKTREYKEELRVERLNQLKQNIGIVLNQTNWNGFFKILLGLGFTSNKLISSDNNIYLAYMFYLFGKERFKLDYYELEKYIGRFYVYFNLSSKYTGGSPESILERDLKALERLNSKQDFIDFIEKEISNELTNDYWTISILNNLETSGVKNPTYITYLASLVKSNSKVLFSNNFLKDLLNDEFVFKKELLDRHHIFPKNYLVEVYGLDTQKDKSIINQIANITYIGYNDNIKISDRSPKEYYEEMIKIYGKNKVEQGLIANCIPLNFYDLQYKDFLNERRKLISQKIKEYFDGLLFDNTVELENISYKDLILNGESNTVEFKSSLRYDYKTNQVNKVLEYVIVKTVSAFLNSNGGTLFIGVDDEGNILGLEKDYQTFSDNNKDGFLKHLDNLIKTNIGMANYNGILSVNIEKTDGKDICIIKVSNRGSKPVYITNNGKEEFFIRASASSQPLSLSETTEYVRNNWS